MAKTIANYARLMDAFIGEMLTLIKRIERIEGYFLRHNTLKDNTQRCVSTRRDERMLAVIMYLRVRVRFGISSD
jgi:hypothetical protein